jgi:hypothetical protein
MENIKDSSLINICGVILSFLTMLLIVYLWGKSFKEIILDQKKNF